MSEKINKVKFTLEDANALAAELGIDWESVDFNAEQFLRGLQVELEHGTKSPESNVTDDDPLLTGKIALVHLRELPDYYDRLAKMENAVDSQDEPTERAASTVPPAFISVHGTVYRQYKPPRFIQVNGHVYEFVSATVQGRELKIKESLDEIIMYTDNIRDHVDKDLPVAIQTLEAFVHGHDVVNVESLNKLTDKAKSTKSKIWDLIESIEQFDDTSIPVTEKPVQEKVEELDNDIEELEENKV